MQQVMLFTPLSDHTRFRFLLDSLVLVASGRSLLQRSGLSYSQFWLFEITVSDRNLILHREIKII